MEIIPKITIVEINKDILLALVVSHSRLAQAEYNRNSDYNDDHFSCKAEAGMIVELDRLRLMDECFRLME